MAQRNKVRMKGKRVFLRMMEGGRIGTVGSFCSQAGLRGSGMAGMRAYVIWK
jgi:hypothetical protein